MAKLKRFALGIIILSFLLLLNTHYFLSHDLHREYLGNKEVVQGFEGRVIITGVVVDKNKNEYYLKIKHKSKSKTIKIISKLL